MAPLSLSGLNRVAARAVARPAFQPYLMGMPQTAASPQLSRPLLAMAALFGALIAATLGLWAHYGTAVFFEIVRAGIAACF